MAVATNPFRTFWDLGFRKLVPIIPPGAPLSERSTMFKRAKVGRDRPGTGTEDAHGKAGGGKDPRGKVPGYKLPDGLWRSFNWMSAETTEDLLDRWNEMGAGVGIKTGDQGDGTSLIAIDADVLDLERALAICDVVREAFGKLPTRIGQFPKAIHLLRIRGTLPYHRLEFDGAGRREQVELLSDGRQFVAHGVHPATGKGYKWPVPLTVPFSELPVAEAETLLSTIERLTETLPNGCCKKLNSLSEDGGMPPDQESLKGDLELVRSAIEALPNSDAIFPSRGDAISVGFALKGALQDHPEEALELFHLWGAKWEGRDGETNDPAWLDAEWGTLNPPFRSGAEKIYRLARQHAGWSGDRDALAARWFDADAAAEAVANESRAAFPASANRAPRFVFLSQQEAAAAALTQSAEPLIDGLLDQGAMSVLYGDSNTGKTFIALDMAGAVATGSEWAGMPAAHFHVAYIAAEGGRGILKRIAALNLLRPSNRLHVLNSPVDLGRVDADLRPLVEAVREIPSAVGLVVIDTLSRVLSGRDENSSVEMGALVACMTALQSETKAHVMVIHHTGKDAARGARGHSLLRAAIDTEIEVVSDGPGHGRIQVTKQRDMELGFETKFELRDRVLGVDSEASALQRPLPAAMLEIVARSAKKDQAPGSD
ncbi:bifunctional DNA primase/polymerase-like protein [Enterovirga rhinocerotis]|uniref:Bifunctional DNA primase/polymerase-like protein n=1 Tax=Enterovirga rhinocerotis TaxID=1339210 RepID=A0A4R7C896_9HYPH|nr:bifunctional DNA primase/polymerase-like protein [Enterovirga rhinocerotis]